MNILPKFQPVVKPTNPINNAAALANQALGGVISGTDINPAPMGNTQAAPLQSRLPQPTVQERQNQIRQGASDQHAARLAAITRRASAQRASAGGVAVGAGLKPGAYGKSQGGAFSGGAYGLTPQAANALAAMSAAYQRQFGSPLTVNSGGRSYQEQAQAYAAYKSGRGNLAAPPGTSVHESGRAVDLGGAIQNAGSAQHQWLQANAGQFGWLWTGKNFSQFEPWHWEYQG